MALPESSQIITKTQQQQQQGHNNIFTKPNNSNTE